MRMTMFCIEIDIKEGNFRYSNASHLAPFFARKLKNEEIEKIEVDCLSEEPGPCLGAQREQDYQQFAGKFSSDDVLVLYTDGLLEAKDEKKRFYGDRRVIRSLRRSGLKDAKAARDLIINDFCCEISDKERKDDITVVVIKNNSSPTKDSLPVENGEKIAI